MHTRWGVIVSSTEVCRAELLCEKAKVEYFIFYEILTVKKSDYKKYC